ncbi:MAG: ATP-binding cassette domain-containing protein [Pseudomonadota bacterium]
MTQATSQPGLVLDDVTITLHSAPLLTIERTIPPGDIVTVMGPSGVGKSTLLDYICGTLAPVFDARGTVSVAGRRIDHLPPQQRDIGILFQDDLLFPHLSVGANLAFAIKPSIKPRAKRRAMVEEALDAAGLAGFMDRDPATLSGGQRARVSVMRVLLSDPKALLLDEPFSKLDAALRQQFRAFVFELTKARHLPVLMVTHDADDAASAGGAVIELQPSSTGAQPG